MSLRFQGFPKEMLANTFESVLPCSEGDRSAVLELGIIQIIEGFKEILWSAGYTNLVGGIEINVGDQKVSKSI